MQEVIITLRKLNFQGPFTLLLSVLSKIIYSHFEGTIYSVQI